MPGGLSGTGREETRRSDSCPPVLLVLIDGVGDVELSEREGPASRSPSSSSSVSVVTRTPLSMAAIPVLDTVARVGANGLIDPVEPGLACGSDTAHLSLFGYDPRVVYRCVCWVLV